MSDDLLARIDQVTDEWDSWDGDSADAMRWTPDLPERGTMPGIVPTVWRPSTVRITVYMQAMRDLAAALRPIVEALAAAATAAAEAGAAVQESRQRARPKHVPPMWADVPTQQRRRR